MCNERRRAGSHSWALAIGSVCKYVDERATHTHTHRRAGGKKTGEGQGGERKREEGDVRRTHSGMQGKRGKGQGDGGNHEEGKREEEDLGNGSGRDRAKI